MGDKKFKTFEEFLSHYGDDAEKAARAAYRTVNAREEDNADLREEKRVLKADKAALETEVEDLKKKVPSTDQEVMTPEVKKELEAYRALGTVKDLTEELPTLRSTVSSAKLTTALIDAKVPQENLKTAELILKASEDAYFEDVEVEKDGQKTKVRRLNAKKLAEDHPSLGITVGSEEGKDDDASGKTPVRVVTGARGTTAPKAGALSEASKSLTKARYPGPKKR